MVGWVAMVTEGPTVLKHQGLFYMIYSANDFRNPDYAVGYAISESPIGPWKKSERNPIIQGKHFGLSGRGHGVAFKDEKGFLYYDFQTHFNDSMVHPRKTAIINIDF